MPKRPKHASTPIEDEGSVDVPDSQKEHYKKLGYKPYLSDGGKIKWLSYEQHVYEKIKYDSKKGLASLKKLRPSRQKLIRAFRRFTKAMLRNWFLLLLAAAVIFILLFQNLILDFFR